MKCHHISIHCIAKNITETWPAILCSILFGNTVLCTSFYTAATGIITDTLSAVILLHVEEFYEKYFWKKKKKPVTRTLICTTFGVRKQYWWRFKSSGMWCRVTGWIVSAVLKALWSFKTAGTASPMTHDRIPEDFNLRHLFVLIRVFQTLIRAQLSTVTTQYIKSIQDGVL